MKDQFSREELQKTAMRAKKLSEVSHIDAEWKRIYEKLEDAALVLDAFSAVEDKGLYMDKI